MPSQVVEAIWNVTAAQLSPDPVRTAVMECADPDDSKRAAALKARTYRRGDGVDDSAGTTRYLGCYQPVPLDMRPEQEGQRRAVDRARGPAAAPCLLALAGRPYSTAPLRSAVIGSGRGAHAIELRMCDSTRPAARSSEKRVAATVAQTF